VDADNEAARALYTAAGFALAAEDGGWLGLPRRQLLRKELRPARAGGGPERGPGRGSGAGLDAGAASLSLEPALHPGGGAGSAPRSTVAAAPGAEAPSAETGVSAAGAAPEAASGGGDCGSENGAAEAPDLRQPGAVGPAAGHKSRSGAGQGGRTYVWDVRTNGRP